MFSKRTAALSGITLSILAACSTENCGDPSKDSFGTALNCVVSSDGYQAQNAALAAEARSRQSLAAELGAENQRLNATLASLTGEQRRIAGRLRSVNSQLASLDRQLADQLQRQEISQAEYNLAQSQLNAANSTRRGVNPTDPQAQARLDALESEVAELQSLLDG